MEQQCRFAGDIRCIPCSQWSPIANVDPVAAVEDIIATAAVEVVVASFSK
jgi:hypothetical protein